MLPAKAFALPFPVPPTPSWRELASNVYAKFASYLLRDPATRLQGGRTGSDSEHRQHVTSLAGYENPRSGHRTRVSGGGVRSYGYALSSGLDQARARLGPRPPPSLTPPAGVEPRDCHTGTAASRGLETERKRDETERSPATATGGWPLHGGSIRNVNET